MSVFKDNVIVITGASTGIGEELAYRLAPAWCQVGPHRAQAG